MYHTKFFLSSSSKIICSNVLLIHMVYVKFTSILANWLSKGSTESNENEMFDNFIDYIILYEFGRRLTFNFPLESFIISYSFSYLPYFLNVSIIFSGGVVYWYFWNLCLRWEIILFWIYCSKKNEEKLTKAGSCNSILMWFKFYFT